MGRVRVRALVLALLGLLAVVGAGGCSRAVEGRPGAVPPGAGPGAAAAPVLPPPGAPDPTARAGPPPEPSPQPAPEPGAQDPTAGAGPAPSRARARPSALQPDVLADECLLDAAQLAALLGTPVRAPEQAVVRRDDGSRTSGCSVTAEGDPAPLAAVNVYRVRTGTAEQFVRAGAGGGRALRGVGRAGTAAVVLDTAAGPTLQVASARFLVTVAVHGRAPADGAWRAAARAALARLPR